MAPNYAYGLVQRYVESKVGNNIVELYIRINRFIQENGPIIESIYRNLNILDSTIFGRISRNLMEDSIRKDLQGALEDQKSYQQICDDVGEQLFKMTERVDVEEFLKENGVSNLSKEQIGYFISEVKLYWAVTYGNHIERLYKVHMLLLQLKKELDDEVKLLQQLSNESFFDALQTNERLRKEFYEEKAIFLKIIDESRIQSDEVKQIEANLQAHIVKLRFQMEAYIKATKTMGGTAYRDVYVDLASAQSDLQRAILSLGYLLGAFYIIIKIPSSMIMKKSSWGFGLIHKDLSVTSQRLLSEATNLLVGKFLPT